MAAKPNYEIRVGLFTIVALALLVWGWGWLKSASLFHPPQMFNVAFHDIAGLNKNANVQINGVRVGVVDDIQLVTAGQVMVHVKITAPNVRVLEGSTVNIQTLGLVGAKYLEITLPDVQPGQSPPLALRENEVIPGQDPVRVELVINDIATRISAVITPATSGKSGSKLSRALERSGVIIENIDAASAKFSKNMDRLAITADSVTATSNRINKAVGHIDTIASSADNFFIEGAQTMHGIKGTANKVSALLDNPNFSADLKETAQSIRQTSQNISATISELNATLKDQGTRTDLITMLNRLNDSTANIAKSLVVVDKIASDQGLRADVKEAVANAKEAVTKADKLLESANFKDDVSTTMSKMRSAASNVDIAAQQLSTILDKRAPLLHMMFGRPGKIRVEESQAKNPSDVTK
jgi:phospholipid/cholesterol/gamma-HCH transport system substrate-binding protein